MPADAEPLHPVYLRLLVVVNRCQATDLQPAGGIWPIFSFSPWQRSAAAYRTFLQIDRRRGPVAGSSAGDLAVGQGLLELGDPGVGDFGVT
jgi:hypothetical protein